MTTSRWNDTCNRDSNEEREEEREFAKRVTTKIAHWKSSTASNRLYRSERPRQPPGIGCHSISGTATFVQRSATLGDECTPASGRSLCREKDSRMVGASCGVSEGYRCCLRGNGLLFRQCDEQPLNLALLVWDGEAGLHHGDSLPQYRRAAQLAHQ